LPPYRKANYVTVAKTHIPFGKFIKELKYLGMTEKNQNYVHKEVKSRLNPGNVFYYSLKNYFPHLIKNVNFKNKNLPVFEWA
jgi:hypothetical protein